MPVSPSHLATPPRTVPRGLQLRLYSPGDLYWGLAFLVMAAALVFLIPAGASDIRRAFTAIGAALLWLLALKVVTPPLLRARAAIRLMRDGVLTAGRVVASRFVWDRKKHEMPHAQLISDWQAQLSKSQVRKAWGWTWVFLLPILGPLALFVFGTGVAMVMGMLGHETTARGREGEILSVAFTIVVVIVAVVIFWRMVGAMVVGSVGARGGGTGIAPIAPEGETFEETESRLRQAAFRESGPPDISAPLPPQTGIQLSCRVTYSAAGEARSAEGRMFLGDRVDRAGIEPLLYDRLEPRKVLLLAGLAKDVEIDSLGRWKDLPGSGAPICVTAIVGLVVLAGILLEAPAVMLAMGK